MTVRKTCTTIVHRNKLIKGALKGAHSQNACDLRFRVKETKKNTTYKSPLAGITLQNCQKFHALARIYELCGRESKKATEGASVNCYM